MQVEHLHFTWSVWRVICYSADGRKNSEVAQQTHRKGDKNKPQQKKKMKKNRGSKINMKSTELLFLQKVSGKVSTESLNDVWIQTKNKSYILVATHQNYECTLISGYKKKYVQSSVQDIKQSECERPMYVHVSTQICTHDLIFNQHSKNKTLKALISAFNTKYRT